MNRINWIIDPKFVWFMLV